MISIIINNYNYERFVGMAVESALSVSDAEVIVVDDGSRDGSLDVLERYQDRVIIIAKENGGQASAYNAGFAASRGDVVVFLDADDCIGADWAAALKSQYSPSATIYQWQLRCIGEDGQPFQPDRLDPERLTPGPVKEALLDEAWYVHPPASGNAYSRPFLQKVMPMPEEDYRYFADIHLINSAPLFGDRVVLPGVLGLYRRHGANHSTRSSRFGRRNVEHRVQAHQRRVHALRSGAERAGMSLPAKMDLRAPFAALDRLILAWHDPASLASPGEIPGIAGEGIRSAWRSARAGGLPKRIVLTALFLILPCILLTQYLWLKTCRPNLKQL